MPNIDQDTPRIYVACLASYNAGHLHGSWIDCDQDADAIEAEIAAMLAESPQPHAEEWAIHDHENWGGLELFEFENLNTLARVAELIADHGLMIAALISYLGGTEHLDEAERMARDQYHGTWRSFRDFADEQADELLLPGVPEAVRAYFDYESYARDLELGGEYISIEAAGAVHVFGAR